MPYNLKISCKETNIRKTNREKKFDNMSKNVHIIP